MLLPLPAGHSFEGRTRNMKRFAVARYLRRKTVAKFVWTHRYTIANRKTRTLRLSIRDFCRRRPCVVGRPRPPSSSHQVELGPICWLGPVFSDPIQYDSMGQSFL